MPRNKLKGLSYSAYAEHRKSLGLSGCTKQSVHEAVKSGRITTLSDGSIDQTKADRLWRDRTDARRVRIRRGTSQNSTATNARTCQVNGFEDRSSEALVREGRVSALANITAPDEVLRFAAECIDLGLTAPEAYAVAQLYCFRCAAALTDIRCDDFDARFSDPEPHQWREVLGDFDQEEADALCDSVFLGGE